MATCWSLLLLTVARCSAQPDPASKFAAPRFVRNDEIEKVVPLPPGDYPKSLQGMLWMDQTGSFGFSNISGGAPDLAFSTGDTKYAQLNRETRQLDINIFGPAWQWQNNAEAYEFHHDLLTGPWSHLGVKFHHYEFVFNDDYSFAQIYPVMQSALGNVYRVPESMLSFTMTLQTPNPGQCPPKEGATREEISSCALWRRESRVFTVVPGIAKNIGTFVYYAYQIVDQKGNRIEPYYSAYKDWANENSKPDAEAAAKFGLTLGTTGSANGSSFVGRYKDAVSLVV